MKKTHEVIVEVTNTGLSAYVTDLDGVVTTGGSLAEIEKNIKEAIAFYYEDIPSSKKKVIEVKLKVDLKQFFKHYNIINQKRMAALVGINEALMSQYVSGRKTPSPKQLFKISSGINNIGKELTQIHF